MKKEDITWYMRSHHGNILNNISLVTFEEYGNTVSEKSAITFGSNSIIRITGHRNYNLPKSRMKFWADADNKKIEDLTFDELTQLIKWTFEYRIENEI